MPHTHTTRDIEREIKSKSSNIPEVLCQEDIKTKNKTETDMER